MPLAQALADFKVSLAQCDSLIVNAHKVDSAGIALFPAIDQRQITVAAFLNMFIAWETFLEYSLVALMTGSATLSGKMPTRFVSPLTAAAARGLLIGTQRFFDFGNHEFVRRMAPLFFDQGYPYEPHLSSLVAELQDLRTMRNWAAHITSTTQTAIESLALRIFTKPVVGIDLYQMLTTNDPRSTVGETVYLSYKTKLLVAGELIAQG